MARKSPRCQLKAELYFLTPAALAGITTLPQFRESPETAKLQLFAGSPAPGDWATAAAEIRAKPPVSIVTRRRQRERVVMTNLYAGTFVLLLLCFTVTGSRKVIMARNSSPTFSIFCCCSFSRVA